MVSSIYTGFTLRTSIECQVAYSVAQSTEAAEWTKTFARNLHNFDTPLNYWYKGKKRSY